MKFILLIGAGLIAAPSAGAEIIRTEVCRKGGDIRTIEVVSPGAVGLACDVVYTRDAGANVAIPYNANVDKDFCRARAAELAATLISDGFDCAPEAPDSIEAALAGGDDVGGAIAADAPLNVQLELLNEGAPATPAANIAALETPVEAAPDSGPDMTDYERKIAAPEGKTAAEPVHLAAGALPSAYKAPQPPKASGPRRIIGATPSLDIILDASAASALKETPDAPLPDKIPARDASDVIRGVLAANAAAWNEGNLDSYMNGYANADDLLMVKDGVVTTGWRDVRKAYEAEIAALAGMGRLKFEGVDVTLTSGDIATVVGRYALAVGDANKEGVMTLVMKQIDGRWRITQDTRVASAAANP